MRLTAMRNASSARRPASVSSVILAAEVVFQLLGVGLVQLAAAAHVGPPLGDLALQLVVAGERHRPASHAGAAIGRMDWVVVQTPRSASTTAAHWRRCSASSARPWSVMR